VNPSPSVVETHLAIAARPSARNEPAKRSLYPCSNRGKACRVDTVTLLEDSGWPTLCVFGFLQRVSAALRFLHGPYNQCDAEFIKRRCSPNMNEPLFGITYALAGVTCLAAGFQRRKFLLPLSGVMIVVAALNTYVEEWPNLKLIKFEVAAPLLLFGFLWPYTALSMSLMEKLGIQGRLPRFVSSFLPVIYAMAVGVVLNVPTFGTLENPPLVLFVFIVFLVVLHVPGFVAGKSKAIKNQEFTSGPLTGMRSHLPLKIIILVLATPLFVVLLLQITKRDDWRLFGSDAVLTAAIATLFVIARDN